MLKPKLLYNATYKVPNWDFLATCRNITSHLNASFKAVYTTTTITYERHLNKKHFFTCQEAPKFRYMLLEAPSLCLHPADVGTLQWSASLETKVWKKIQNVWNQISLAICLLLNER